MVRIRVVPLGLQGHHQGVNAALALRAKDLQAMLAAIAPVAAGVVATSLPGADDGGPIVVTGSFLHPAAADVALAVAQVSTPHPLTGRRY